MYHLRIVLLSSLIALISVTDATSIEMSFVVSPTQTTDICNDFDCESSGAAKNCITAIYADSQQSMIASQTNDVRICDSVARVINFCDNTLSLIITRINSRFNLNITGAFVSSGASLATHPNQSHPTGLSRLSHHSLSAEKVVV